MTDELRVDCSFQVHHHVIERRDEAMSELSERYRRIAGTFTRTVGDVPAGAWDNPSPCEGWTARDVVGHLVDWLPHFFFGRWDVEGPAHPPVAEDPLGAWTAVSETIQAALDDPEVARAERDTPMGPSTFEQTFDMIGTNDVFLHTWDVARATGLDERLDPEEVHRLFEGMEPYGDAMRRSGHYGPATEVPEDADEQTRLLAFIGRRP
jgi:uncharacterized protein (TIGR03086 family)